MHLRQALYAAFMAACATLIASPTARATVVSAVTLESLTRQADEVIVATVVQSHAQWLDGRIVTDHQLRVVAVMKGRATPEASVMLETPGGVVGHLAQSIAGVPTLGPGGTYILFLSVGPTGLRYLTHLTASVMPMGTDPVSGDVMGTLPEGLTAVSDVTARGTVSLETLQRAVRSVVRP